MSRIEKFLAKPKEVKIGDELVTVKPLSMGDFDLVMNLSDKDPKVKNAAIKGVMNKTIKSAFPEATDENINDFSFEFLNDILNAMVEVNNLEISEADRKKLLKGLETVD